ncbi:DUF2147 domain-containing protein [Burkholderia sp. BCC1998]|uniref:DUF2147 domain-containing protein n=1 Tax=Burkholderia sp. BCC1998 TaxID=2817447 RepID=UPI002AB6A785|nr:DUF2147 domain-containing protein [Burkholderia sp. BCC1998]
MHFVNSKFKLLRLSLTVYLSVATVAFASDAAPDRLASVGLWVTAEHDAVIEFRPCADNNETLCGVIAWDEDAIPGGRRASCGVRVAQLSHFSNGAWRDGWAFDPRTRKRYETVLRVVGDKMTMRSFIGLELFGETEELSRINQLPTGCPQVHLN